MRNRQIRLDRIANVISLSQHYSGHKMRLQHVQSCIDSQNMKMNAKRALLLDQKARYRKIVTSMQEEKVRERNGKVVTRLTDILEKSPPKNQFRQTAVSRKTIKSLKTSKERYRAKKSFQIERENEVMTSRVSESRSKDSYGPLRFRDEYKEQCKYKQLSGRYSDRSQNVLHSMITKDLGIEAKDLPFLPQLRRRLC